jgi:hypothetical protein
MNLGFRVARFHYDWHYYNGHEYALTEHWQPWLDNEAEAESVGGHLVTINDQAENDWLVATFTATPMGEHGFPEWYAAGAQIGYYLNHDTGAWGWISGEPVTFTIYENGFVGGNGEHAYLSVPPCWAATLWGCDPGHTEPGKPVEGYLKGIIERPASGG